MELPSELSRLTVPFLLSSIHAEPQNETTEQGVPPIEEIKRQIARYNEQQSVLNEETFGPLLDDSVIIVVQVSDS